MSLLLLYLLMGVLSCSLVFQSKNKHIEKKWYIILFTIIFWPPALLPLILDIRNE